MNFFEWVKNSAKNLKDIESKIYHDKSQFVEIYQRNLALEKEIAQRTEELHKTNQTLLTLEHIWNMMNSSRPLSNVLEAIVESLQGEFGYLYSCILQKTVDKDGEFFTFRTFVKTDFLERINYLLPQAVYDTRMRFVKGGILDSAIQDGEVRYYNKIGEILQEVFPALNDESILKIQKNALTQAIIVLPLKSMDEFYRCLGVFSPRGEPTQSELKFLSLFAKQIELAITIANLFETVKKQAVTDPLTELFNRRFYEDAITREASRALRLNQPFSLISLDLDDLKQINDTYGHSAGDKAIETIARAIFENARSVDIASRIGGEEFTIILPGIDSKGAAAAAERIRTSIEAQEIEGVGQITASIGVATFIEQTLDLDELMEMADMAMYNAKKNGKNRVITAQIQDEVSWQDVAVETFVQILEKHKIPFDSKTAQSLSKKLQTKEFQRKGNSTKDLLFDIVDAISQTYTPGYLEGTTKDKVFLATMLAKKFELSKTDIDRLRIAILLYDIGKTLVPSEILRKIGPLTDEEKDKITKHPILAAQKILKPISKVADVIPIIEQHHEYWDGTGYPNKKRGEEIPIISQIILIVDAYFAMTAERPYRKALSPKGAIEEIEKDSGIKYNVDLTRQFVKVLTENNIL